MDDDNDNDNDINDTDVVASPFTTINVERVVSTVLQISYLQRRRAVEILSLR